MIRSHSNPRVKEAIRLQKSKARRKSGKFLIDGLKELQLAIANNFPIETVYYSGERPQLSLQRDAMQEVTPKILERLSYGQRADSIVAVAVAPSDCFAKKNVSLDSQSLVLVLDETEKPGNLGACLRTASACGVKAVILTDPICEILNPNTIRSSRGAVFTVPIALATKTELASMCKSNGLQLLCARVDGCPSFWECDFKSGCAIVFGNEAKGLDSSWDEVATVSFSIAMEGAPDSLNLSISAAVTLYEAIRQRRMASD